MAKIEEVREGSVKKAKRQQPAAIKYYLVAYNFANALGWGYILVSTLIHIFALDQGSVSVTGWVDRPAGYPAWALYFEKNFLPNEWFHTFRRCGTTGEKLGRATTIVQTFAILEVLHSLLGWVRSPFGTVLMQVASRYYAIYGVNYLFPHTLQNPIYTTMVLSWSFTEVIRYIFYALNLLGTEPYPLLWLRYTTFWLLYPTGASSEAFLIFATLPSLHEKPLAYWGLHEWFRLAMFGIWWPSLYVLYTYMIKQRRKVLGGAGKKTKAQ
ncbi:protein tyrosine phosphatase [Irpex rosettiformis]|uniref:Protein tyrosine phosphatase n=1 Tax=Irpex rosettiformis TaxID=378272 RepID=A0ACB8TSX8_9APHY|nr:protein tyrosine phosphatase [Irpex rosettiformis]